MRHPQVRHTARNAAILIAAFLLCCALAWPFLRAHLEALAVLKAVGGQPLPALLKAVASEPVTQHDEFIHTEAGRCVRVSTQPHVTRMLTA